MAESMTERPVRPLSGGLMLLVFLATIGLSLVGIIRSGESLDMGEGGGLMMFLSILALVVSVICLVGLFVVNPNEARALVLFGNYKGTVRENGFYWVIPFYVKRLVSLRARNLDGGQLKVNDKAGNPIEIAAVVVWRVKDTAQALFEVDDYRGYVATQAEAAVRHLAGTYPYDSHDAEGEISLREGREQVAGVLEQELTERLGQAGVQVIEARLSHLAYAPEIAGAMLQRQQADAVVAARQRIVDGAVGMVEMALDQLQSKQVVELDDERKAAMVSNLLVVLCGDRSVQPVVNSGTLYN